MGAKSGAEHHNVVRLREDKAKVLDLVRAGTDTRNAIVSVGRKPEVLKSWLKDVKFAVDLEQARIDGQEFMKMAVGDNKLDLDFVTFSEQFLDMKVFDHHKTWIDVLEGRTPTWLPEGSIYEPGDNQRLLINVPPEHAKSTVMTVNYAVYRIAMDPNVRIAIVSQTQTRAKEFLYAIKQRLTEPEWLKLQQVYGPSGGWQQTSDEWKQERIYLERSSGDPNPTVQALGVGMQIYGARADLIILDDIITTTNAHEWEKQLNWLQKMAITRLGKNGKLIIAGTRVSSVDFYKELRNPDHWSGGKSPFTYLAMPAVFKFHKDPEKWETLWPRSDRPWPGDEDEEPDEDGLYPKWDGQQLHRRRSEVSAQTWALVYQQQDVEDDAIFPHLAVMGCVNRMRKAGVINPKAPGHPKDGQWVTIMGLDPAMAGKTAAIMYAIDRLTGKRMILDAYNMGDPTPQKIRALIEEWVLRYNPFEVRIEINAFQKAFSLDEDLRNWLASQGTQLREHFTGKNKWDTSFGVAAMSGLFGTVKDGKHNGDALLELPDHERNEHVKALINQLITWKPDTRNPTDLVMALWFCEIRARELVAQGMHRTTHLQNRWATRANTNTRGVINLDELAHEQFNHYL